MSKKKGARKQRIRIAKIILLVAIALLFTVGVVYKKQTAKVFNKAKSKFSYLFNNQKSSSLKYIETQFNPAGLEQVEINYGKSIEESAKIFDLPAHYLKSLCMLECSGRRIIKPRFEPHVYERLKKVKKGSISNYEHVTPEMLKDASDDALRNLASSWGPFQLMGYKCLLLDIKIADIRGDNAVYWGVRWINETYGNQLRKGKFKDAFHIHNTGRSHPIGPPRTYDPNYIKNGLKYMNYFNKPQIDLGE